MAMSNTRLSISHRYIERYGQIYPRFLGLTGNVHVMTSQFRSTTADGAVVEFGLVRRALLEKLRRGLIQKDDVCDAHPELLRAAKNLGRKTGEVCPVCEDAELREITYVFGSRLPAGGACPTSRAELLQLERREDPVQCYAVEVCVQCSFHNLVRKWSAGGRKARRQRQAGQ